MGRLLLLLVLGGLVWYGYGIYFGDDAEGRGITELDEHALRVDLADSRSDDVADPDAIESATPSPTGQAGDAVERLVARLRDGDADVRVRAFTAHRNAEASQRPRIETAILELLAASETADRVAILGSQNAFLHTEFGREALADVVDRVHQEVPSRALELSTDVLEACLTGSIEKADAAARAAVDAVYERHLHLVRRVVFDPANASRARRHKVESGESLESIARRFRKAGVQVEGDTLAIVNRIDNPAAIRVGQLLRVPIDPIHCVAHKASFSLCVYVGDDIVRMYWMSHGKPGHETPETEFTVLDKIPNPDWHHDGRVIPFGDPENPLGRFFVKFRHESYSGFGVHGTNEPDSIGTEASLGCLRLMPDDIHEFTRFVPRGAKLVVR